MVIPQSTVTEKSGDRRSRFSFVLDQLSRGSLLVSLLAVVLALVFGAILICATNSVVAESASYFFSRPSDFFSAVGTAIGGAYGSLFQGAIFNFSGATPAAALYPLVQTLNYSAPLIVAGLGVGIAFRAGLFNVGGQGQILVAASAAGWVAFSFHLAPVIHIAFAMCAGIVGGALWAAVVGLLKAKTGAHEVVVTIMLNYVAFYAISYLLRTPGALQAPGSSNPSSPADLPSAIYPSLTGTADPLNMGIVVSIAATVLVWLILNRSGFGFRLRAVGLNPSAAVASGIELSRSYVAVMAVSGGLLGLAGVAQVLGTVTYGFNSGIDAGIGLQAITVALLGRSRPFGILAAGFLFGAFKAGGFAMQASADVPIDLVLVLQSTVVLFVAAPPVVRWLFRLPGTTTGGRNGAVLPK